MPLQFDSNMSNALQHAVGHVWVRGPTVMLGYFEDEQATKAVLPSMQKNGRGKVINIASGTFLRGAPMFCHYVASKGAVVGQMRAYGTGRTR